MVAIAQALIPCSTPKVITIYIPMLPRNTMAEVSWKCLSVVQQDKSIDSWSTTVSYTLTVTIRVSAIGTSSNFWANTSSITNRTRTIRAYCIMASLDSGTGTALSSFPICPFVASLNAWSRFSGFFFFCTHVHIKRKYFIAIRFHQLQKNVERMPCLSLQVKLIKNGRQ